MLIILRPSLKIVLTSSFCHFLPTIPLYLCSLFATYLQLYHTCLPNKVWLFLHSAHNTFFVTFTKTCAMCTILGDRGSIIYWYTLIFTNFDVTVQIWKIWPLGHLVHQFMNAFTDHRDSDLLVVRCVIIANIAYLLYQMCPTLIDLIPALSLMQPLLSVVGMRNSYLVGFWFYW